MDYKRACEILNLSNTFTEKDLRKKYYKKALENHPDKNHSLDAGEKFGEINDAYIYLQHHLNFEIEDNFDYFFIMKKCLQGILPNIYWDDVFLDTTLRGIFKDCKTVSIKIFDTINKDKALELYSFLSTHRDFLPISNDLLLEMYTCLQKKLNKDNIVILNPTINDLLNDKIFKLEVNHKIYYVPLWHHEVCFDVSSADLIIKSIPELDNHISIDNNNNIIYKVGGKIQDVLNKNEIIINIGKKFFTIPGDKLYIKNLQTYLFRNAGILKSNANELYNTEERSHIYVEIRLY